MAPTRTPNIPYTGDLKSRLANLGKSRNRRRSLKDPQPTPPTSIPPSVPRGPVGPKRKCARKGAYLCKSAYSRPPYDFYARFPRPRWEEDEKTVPFSSPSAFSKGKMLEEFWGKMVDDMGDVDMTGPYYNAHWGVWVGDTGDVIMWDHAKVVLGVEYFLPQDEGGGQGVKKGA